MGNNLVHINAEKYYTQNLTNLILAREEVFLNLYYEENKIQKDEKKNFHENNSQFNHEILKKFTKEEQISYINSHKLSGKLRRYIKTTFFFNFNIPEIKEIVNQKIKSINLFEESKENITQLNIFGLKLFHIVKKYMISVLPEDLKFIAEEPLFYYFSNQLYKPLTKDEIIYSINDFFSLVDLTENELSELFNVKSDNNFKEQINEIKSLKKKYFKVVQKYFDKENKENNEGNKYFLLFILISSIIILFMAIFIYKIL